MLTPEELRSRRQKRRRLLIIGVAAVLLAGMALFAAKPASHALKSWQARRHATKAFALIERENWSAAKDEAVAAYQLRPTEPQAVRAVARLLSRTRQPQALEYWELLAKQAPLTRDDLRDEATAALAASDTARASRAITELLKTSPVPRDELLAAQHALQSGKPRDAQSHVDNVLANAAATEPEQFEAALVQVRLAADAQPDDPRSIAAWDRLTRLSRGNTSTALQALVLLAQRALAPRAGAAPVLSSPSDLGALTDALHSHPLAKVPHKLLALDLRGQADPSQRSVLIDLAIADWSNADPTSQAALAAWLNGKGEYQRELDTIPFERAIQSRELFLQHVDALGALGRWVEIKKLLEAERFPLDPVMQRMYLARCNAQLGEQTASENNWQRAYEAATGDVGKLMVLAQYAEKNGALDIAERSFTQAAARSPNLRAAQDGRLRVAVPAKDTRRIHAVLAEMLHEWPGDPAIQNDEAYMRLLLLPRGPAAADEVGQIQVLASRLVNENPASLPHRTLLALSAVLQNQPLKAAEVYERVVFTPGTVNPSAMAVHAAAMAANGQLDDARKEAALLPREALLPEEVALLETFLRTQ